MWNSRLNDQVNVPMTEVELLASESKLKCVLKA